MYKYPTTRQKRCYTMSLSCEIWMSEKQTTWNMYYD